MCDDEQSREVKTIIIIINAPTKEWSQVFIYFFGENQL